MIDALTARALQAELQGTVAGGRIQSVYFVSPQVIGLEIYANHNRHYVLMSAEPQRARALIVSDKLRTASVPLTPFFLLLKKYVNGSFLNRVQVIARERILLFEFDHRAQGVSTLVVELMGNRANLILLDAGGIILDALRRVPPGGNRAREIVPRGKYFPPPPQPKADPLAVTQPQLESLLEQAHGDTLAEKLVASISGTSPLFARELAFRVAADTAAPYSPALTRSIYNQLISAWQSPAAPSLALEDNHPVAIAAFSLTQYRTVETIPSMSAALEKYFGAVESYEAVKAPLVAQLNGALERMERTRASLQRELVPPEEIERLKTQGEMILGYQYELTEGQTLLHAPVNDELTLDITLDPSLNPVENANRYFDEYKRARDARDRVPERIANVENDIQYVQQLINDLEMAESRAEIDLVMDEARQAGVIRETAMRTGGKIVRAEPRHFVSPDNFQVLVGRNARQNDTITFERAHPEDLWLHVRGRAGSHVIIQSNGRTVPESTLEFAASLAAYYSQSRSDGGVDVVYTPRKNVHRVRGAGAHPGLVTVRDEQVIRVKPQAPEQ
jgi:predicted ribosome quality control (RQC) complex YloA/Tae2 family protein